MLWHCCALLMGAQIVIQRVRWGDGSGMKHGRILDYSVIDVVSIISMLELRMVI